jgi:hypothetical protein
VTTSRVRVQTEWPRRPTNQLTDGGPSATAELPDGMVVDIKAATTTNRGTALPLPQEYGKGQTGDWSQQTARQSGVVSDGFLCLTCGG